MDVGTKKYTLMKTLCSTFKRNFPVKWLPTSTVSGLIPDWETILNFCFRKNILKPKMKRIELRNCKEKTLNSEKIITNDIWMQFFNYEFFITFSLINEKTKLKSMSFYLNELNYIEPFNPFISFYLRFFLLFLSGFFKFPSCNQVFYLWWSVNKSE